MGGCYVYRGTTPVTAAMFNVRNVLTDSPVHYGGYTSKEQKKIYNDYQQTSDVLQLMENDYLAGLGFMCSYELELNDWMNGNVLQKINAGTCSLPFSAGWNVAREAFMESTGTISIPKKLWFLGEVGQPEYGKSYIRISS